MRSAHVVQILDYGVDGGTPFIVMELLVGENLAERLRRVGTLPPIATATFLDQVARALTRAHELGIVHRDLKPDNLFIAREGDQEIIKVLDFGIAKQHEAIPGGGVQTRTGAILGTPYYMSPEQAAGRRAVDHRADIWSMAVVAFECLTGQRPFRDSSLGGLLLAICNDPAPVPSQLAPVPPEFDQWFARGVAKDPDARFRSAREAAEELLRVCRASNQSRPTHPREAGVLELGTTKLGLEPHTRQRPALGDGLEPPRTDLGQASSLLVADPVPPTESFAGALSANSAMARSTASQMTPSSVGVRERDRRSGSRLFWTFFALGMAAATAATMFVVGLRIRAARERSTAMGVPSTARFTGSAARSTEHRAPQPAASESRQDVSPTLANPSASSAPDWAQSAPAHSAKSDLSPLRASQSQAARGSPVRLAPRAAAGDVVMRSATDASRPAGKTPAAQPSKPPERPRVDREVGF